MKKVAQGATGWLVWLSVRLAQSLLQGHVIDSDLRPFASCHAPLFTFVHLSIVVRICV